ncbi:Ig-like domain-containing protein [Treponema sp.]|uniref:Ig-like domain-containing protein n=1 Tax=Treponema sp. TaxID=166 RepID=UPI00298D8588|nr:Ig-like domain-containing protein [Treponema sp.]MCQ2241450.1 Ig-like domain-containing protein [Treponema sp.]
MKFNKVFSFSIVLLFFSCSLISTKEENIMCSIPENTEYFYGEYVSFVFSDFCNRVEAEKCITMSEKSRTVACDKIWDENVLMVRPSGNWKKGLLYELSFDGNMNINNQNIYAYIKRAFYYGDENYISKLKPLDIKFPKNEEDSLLITYDTKLEIDSLYDNIHMTPSINFEKQLIDDDKTIVISPIEKWKTSVFYKISFENIKTVDFYYLEKEELIFKIDGNKKLPELKKICRVLKNDDEFVFDEETDLYSGIKTLDSIGFEFSNPMEYESVKNGISFIPYVEGSLHKGDKEGFKYVFVPEKEFKAKQRYEISINKNVKDTNENELYEKLYSVFIPYKNYLKILNLKVNSISIPIDKKNSCTTFVPNKTDTIINGETKTEYSCYITISFSSGFTKEELKSVTDKITLNLLFPLTENYPVVKNIFWSSESIVTIEYGNLNLGTADKNIFYQLKVNGTESGIKNQINEYMEESECFILESCGL